ncbi:thioredoxin domain-containing protein [Asticcacaulis sp. EMRT-3]|uniref:thioredoxin domain-containing protein n=1 Tax=Asticcacaulis sp. EMRT-3 TaxID=3040349 RepID=UPI0024AFBBFF|nr:thioredoxin domain-containing protein [Asticcacaulis sp. EMRT-3]MDI7774061.1 thioredoxin domain-containing protein [Asticcacaulis sp. EMRT-3]
MARLMRGFAGVLITGMMVLGLPASAADHAAAIPALVMPSSDPKLLPDMTLGNPKAPVTVIEYASAACPHCAAWKKENWANFQAKYLATGKVHYIFREVLTSPQQYALSAFLIGRCAVNQSANPKDSTPYFKVVDTFFKDQDDYYQTGQVGTVLADVTKAVGISHQAELDCVADGPSFSAFMDTMNAHMAADHVNSTPTFFVNGKRLESHEMSDIEAAIAAAK